MALSVISTVQSAAISATGPIVLPAFNAIAGDLIVVAARVGGSAMITSVSDTARNTYTTLSPVSVGTIGMRMFYAKNVKANAANVIQISASATTGLGNFIGCAWLVSGADTVAPLDAQATGKNAGGSPISTGTFTTAANEIILSATTGNVNAAGGAWATNSGDVVDSVGYPVGQNTAAQQHRIVSSIQINTTESMSFTGLTGISACLIVAASFIASAVAQIDANQLMMTGCGI